MEPTQLLSQEPIRRSIKVPTRLLPRQPIGIFFTSWHGFRVFLRGIPWVNLIPEFWGKDHEDPAVFIRIIEAYFVNMRIPEVHKTITAVSSLKGGA